MGRCVISFDEVPIHNDSSCTGILFLILNSLEHPIAINLMCFKILPHGRFKWPLQFKLNVFPVILKLKEILEPIFIADLHASHRSLLNESNLKMYVPDEKNKEIPFKILNEPQHFFAHNSNLLARKDVILTLSLKTKSGEKPMKVKMKFHGKFFEENEIWNLFRKKASLDLEDLKSFWSNEFLEATLKEMPDNPEKILIQGIFIDLVSLFNLLLEKRNVETRDVKLMKSK